MVLDKTVWTRWNGQNGTNRMVTIFGNPPNGGRKLNKHYVNVRDNSDRSNCVMCINSAI